MNMTQWMQRHRRSLLFLVLMLALGGIASAFFMPVALFPNVSFPRVQMDLEAGDRPADHVRHDFDQAGRKSEFASLSA